VPQDIQWLGNIEPATLRCSVGRSWSPHPASQSQAGKAPGPTPKNGIPPGAAKPLQGWSIPWVRPNEKLDPQLFNFAPFEVTSSSNCRLAIALPTPREGFTCPFNPDLSHHWTGCLARCPGFVARSSTRGPPVKLPRLPWTRNRGTSGTKLPKSEARNTTCLIAGEAGRDRSARGETQTGRFNRTE
jgi:hypothetical protein